MIIAIPVNSNNMQTAICPSFGRAPYFLFYDTHSMSGEFKVNQAASSQGGAGVMAAQTIADGAKALLTPRLGRNAADVLLSAGLKIYKTQGDDLMENINAYKSGQLGELEEIHAGFHRRY